MIVEAPYYILKTLNRVSVERGERERQRQTDRQTDRQKNKEEEILIHS